MRCIWSIKVPAFLARGRVLPAIIVKNRPGPYACGGPDQDCDFRDDKHGNIVERRETRVTIRSGGAKKGVRRTESMSINRFFAAEQRHAIINPTGINWDVIWMKFIRPFIDSVLRLENLRKLPNFEAFCTGGAKLKNSNSRVITASSNQAMKRGNALMQTTASAVRQKFPRKPGKNYPSWGTAWP